MVQTFSSSFSPRIRIVWLHFNRGLGCDYIHIWYMAADDIPILFCGESINVPRFRHRCRYHDGGVSSRNRDKCRVSAIFRITQYIELGRSANPI